MKRLIVLAAVAVVAGTAVLTSSGGAKAPAAPHSITFIDTSTGGFEPTGRPHPGVISGFFGRIRSTDGAVTGHTVGVCTSVTNRKSLCHVQLNLSNGQLSLQGLVHENRRSFVFVVIGGAGAYEGSDGQAQVTDLSDTKTRVAVDLTR